MGFGPATGRLGSGVSPRDAEAAENTAPLRLAHPDWLHHQLTIRGAGEAVAALRGAAAGAGTIPWRLDLERTQEDWFHLLMAPPAPQQRSMSAAGARILAGQLREAVERRHRLALSRVGRSRACPFDLHALLPVADAVLHLGPDHPEALGWMWRHWGTTEALRHVAEAEAAVPASAADADAEAIWRLSFWSADWTPWRALATLAEQWPQLHFETRPRYDEQA